MLSVSLLCLGIAAWLWPIGFGGRMPVGGDVTQFSLGLMAVLRDAIRSARLPIWNDLWGYGFPGLAESQMGVYYPPHWILYGLLPLERAYTTSLVLHTMFAGLGTYWAARQFGASTIGAALAGFAWSTSGFFLIHLPHQWGYTVGSWMPWAWGLAWRITRGEGSWRSPFLLAVVLVLQILPGHFQLAFYTEVGVVLLALAGMSRDQGAWRRPATIALAMVAVIPLAAAQLVPTARLASLASSARSFEYLSGFAASPLHMVSYVAPGLFNRSPLWRPLAWDPFRTSPEEYLGYIGLVPLFLALVAIFRGFRHDRATRALVLLVVVTVLLSFGPYVPGFRYLIKLPGFSFFRASARWSLATGLALALLAGKGFDAWPGWNRAGWALAGFAGLAAVSPALVVLTLEVVLASSQTFSGPGTSSVPTQTLNSLQPSGVSGGSAGEGQGGVGMTRSSAIEKVGRYARKPQDDLRVQAALARQNRPWRSAKYRTFEPMRFSIYRQELTESSVLVLALLLTARFAGRTRCFATALIVLTAVDLWLVGRHRLTDLGPIQPLEQQSPVLARLAAEARGTRTADPLRNMPMVAGSAPILAYRTLDLPCLFELSRTATSPLGVSPAHDSVVASALRSSGVSVRLLDPLETLQLSGSAPQLPGWENRETVQDPALAGWLYSPAWVAQQGERAATFSLLRPTIAPAAAWLVPLTTKREAEILEPHSNQVERVHKTLRNASPVVVERASPTQLEMTLETTGPAVVVVTQLADPQWRARWIGPGGEQDALIEPIFGANPDIGWQSVKVPGPGRWTLRMDYDAWDVRLGLGLSVGAWAMGLLIFVLTSRSVKQARGH